MYRESSVVKGFQNDLDRESRKVWMKFNDKSVCVFQRFGKGRMDKKCADRNVERLVKS